MGQFAVRACLINCLWELLSQYLGNLVNRNVVFRRQLPNSIAPEHLLQLFRRNWQILPSPDPGFDLLAEACLLQLGDDGGKAALPTIAEHFAQHNRQNRSLQLSKGAFKGRRILQ